MGAWVGQSSRTGPGCRNTRMPRVPKFETSQKWTGPASCKTLSRRPARRERERRLHQRPSNICAGGIARIGQGPHALLGECRLEALVCNYQDRRRKCRARLVNLKNRSREDDRRTLRLHRMEQ
ncbi:hypothetical protein C8Q78DRAFT_1011054 [Trametes maxima]|nr:hypothetical protein C8Q78DRAFT_1011054 [Trametes maxima]